MGERVKGRAGDRMMFITVARLLEPSDAATPYHLVTFSPSHLVTLQEGA
jgi:hypothetical protein